MANFSGQQSVISRFLGLCNADDPTNLPVGVAADCRNCAFDLISVRTRDGINTTMQGINKSPIVGLIGALYTPETETESFFQLPMIYDMAGSLQYEQPVGTGRMKAFTYDLLTPPVGSQMVAIQTYNKVFAAFSNLQIPLSGMATIDPKTKSVWPYGMKPWGWQWLASQPVLVGEMACPSTQSGNGHTYRCIQAGKTGIVEPNWPLTEGATFTDGTARWQEYTAVLANRLSPPASPTLSITVGPGTIPAAKDVYIVNTMVNAQGESLPSIPVFITTVSATSEVNVPIPTLAQLPGWMSELGSQYVPTSFNTYVAIVATGSPAPALAIYQEFGTGQALGTTVEVTGAGSGAAPPTVNSARVTPGQIPTPDVEPALTRIPAGGSYAAGLDVYMLVTYRNNLGETKAGPANFIVDTVAGDGIQVTVTEPEDENNNALYAITDIGVYEADVPTGTPAPPSSAFQLVGYFPVGTQVVVTTGPSGPNPPTSNTTGPAGNIVADTSTGGSNGGQGFRYAALMFMNQNYTVSGFTPGSVIQYDVDEDGWEIGVFKVATGPDNVLARIVAFTVADGSSDGPFYWIGNVNLQIPTANFVYPQTFLSDGIPMNATVFQDNTTTNGTFNFTDEYLDGSNDVTDRLDVIWPHQAVHIAYCPSVDRIFQSGVPGYYSGWWVSLAADSESYYGDLSYISVGSDDGERSWGTIEYRGTVYGLRERSGYTFSANPANPQAWTATKRWSEVGPCGPRAFDACGMFMIFVHRSGIYKYEDTTPDLMTKEIPAFWKTINWSAAQNICVKIDHEKHEVHILVPTGTSTVPNLEVVLNYLEGWENPIHFYGYLQKEITQEASRKYSINDVEAWVCDRIERTIAYRNYPYPMGTNEAPMFDPAFFTNQFVYGSSGFDGTVQAVTPGVFSDNGTGIESIYETVAPQTTLALCKIEGFSMNARGNGVLYPYFIAGRAKFDNQHKSGPLDKNVLAVRPINLTPDENEGLSRMVPSKLNERWRLRWSNGKVPGAWWSVKWAAIYSIPMFGARPESQQGG